MLNQAMPSPPITWQPHPRGANGAWSSLQKTAMKASAGRLNPGVRAWAINRIREAGSPRDKLSQAQALYYALLREKTYVSDPVDTELIANAECLLDQCGGLTFNGGDCDDLTVAIVAAFESVGLRACVVSHRYASETLEHVLSAVHDGTRWYYADPSSGAPFGMARVPAREVWVAVPSLVVVCDQPGPCDAQSISPLVEAGRPAGDFLGVGDAGAAQPGATTMSELQPITGRSLADLQRDFLVASSALDRARAEMVIEYRRMRSVRDVIEKPAIDPYVYAGGNQAVWGEEQERKLRGLDQTALVAASYGRQGAAGQRRIERDMATDRTGVVALDTEPAVFVEGDGSVVLANLSDPSQGGEVTPAGFFGPLGWPVVVLVIGCTVAGVIATVALVGAAKDYIARVRQKDLLEHEKGLLDRGLTPEQVTAMMRSVSETAERQAFAEAAKAKEDPLAQIGTIAKWGGIGLLTFGAMAGGLYLVAQARMLKQAREPQLVLAR